MFVSKVFLVFIAFAHCVKSVAANVHKINKTLACTIQTSSFCLPNNYDKFQAPLQNEIGPIDVSVGFYIQQITQINDKDFTISISTSMLLSWNEPRILNLMNNLSLVDHSYYFQRYVPLSYAWIKKIWLPDIYVDAMESANEAQILQPFGCNTKSALNNLTRKLDFP